MGYFVTTQLVEKSLTRPANTDIYAIGDLIGTATSSSLAFTPVEHSTNENLGQVVYITGATLRIDMSAVPGDMNAGFHLLMFNKAPTAVADNAPSALEVAKPYLRTVLAFPTPTDRGAFLFSELQGIKIAFPFLTTEVTMIGNIVTLSAFTPGSAAIFTVGLTLSKV